MLQQLCNKTTRLKINLELTYQIFILPVVTFYFDFNFLGCGYYDNNTDGIIGIQKEINDIIIISSVYAMVI